MRVPPEHRKGTATTVQDEITYASIKLSERLTDMIEVYFFERGLRKRRQSKLFILYHFLFLSLYFEKGGGLAGLCAQRDAMRIPARCSGGGSETVQLTTAPAK